MRKWWLMLLIFALGVVVGALFNKSSRHSTVSTTVDTIVYYRPLPTTTKSNIRTVYVPRLLFAPAETEEQHQDSVQISVPIERREYKDSTYRAVITGAIIGDIRPTIESLEIYQRSTTQTIYTAPPKLRPYISGALGKESVGVGAGLLIANKHAVGVDYAYIGGNGCIMARYSFVFR